MFFLTIKYTFILRLMRNYVQKTVSLATACHRYIYWNLKYTASPATFVTALDITYTGTVSIQRSLSSIGIPMIKLSRSHNCSVFIVEIPVSAMTVFVLKRDGVRTIVLGRGPEGPLCTPYPTPTPHPCKIMFFWTLRVSTIRNKMLTVQIWGLTTDFQLLKTRIPNYRAGKILLWQLWPRNSALYILNGLTLVSNERCVF